MIYCILYMICYILFVVSACSFQDSDYWEAPEKDGSAQWHLRSRASYWKHARKVVNNIGNRSVFWRREAKAVEFLW